MSASSRRGAAVSPLCAVIILSGRRLISHERALGEPAHAGSAAVGARQTVRLFFPRWTSSEWRSSAWTYRTVIPVTCRKIEGRRGKRGGRRGLGHRVGG